MRVAEAPGYETILAQLLSLEFDFGFLFLAREFQSTAANELNDFTQFVAVEPGAVAFANVDDDARAAREIDPVHGLATLGPRNVPDGAIVARSMMRRRR